ncbi:hypothetical protein F5Y03DRAFT_261855 [Xylaria venustula]|nr:hypothetical protein F5Y03DRAFT_261855 [Xylaria venustula]
MLVNALSLAALVGAAMASPCKPSTTTPSYSTSPTTSASPTSTVIAPNEPFGVMSLRSASPIHFAQFDAALNSIFLYLPSQNATCDDGTKSTTADSATFSLSEDGSLYLYSTSNPPQQLFVDRSGMGQGKLGYTTGAQPGPRNGERTSFAIDDYGYLSFNGAGFLACPNSIGGAWSVWVDVGIANPGGNSDCLGLGALAVKITDSPNSCTYTEAQ